MRLDLSTHEKPAVSLSVAKTFYSIPFRFTVDVYTSPNTSNFYVVLDGGFTHETELSVSECEGEPVFRLASRKAFNKQRVVNPILTVTKTIDEAERRKLSADVVSFGIHLKNLGCGNFVSSEDVPYQSISQTPSTKSFSVSEAFEPCRTTLPPQGQFFQSGQLWSRRSLIYNKKRS